MPTLKKNLPNEHGGWVLFVTALIAGVAMNPGWWQIPVVSGWLGVFLFRVPLTRLLDHKGKEVAWRIAIVAALLGAAGFGVASLSHPESLMWAVGAAGPGGILIAARSRRFLRGLFGEILSMTAIVPIIPSVAVAGTLPVRTQVLVVTVIAMAAYLLAAVFRVRAVARLSRDKAAWWESALGAAFLPVVVAAAWASGRVDAPLLWGCLPVFAVSAWMIVVAARSKLSLITVGLLEMASVLPFATGLVISGAPYLS